jgi:2-methylfumaryl-CoA isomerase
MNDLLKGMRIVEASAFIAAPYAGLVMGQMGADVIRIDPVGGGLDYRRWPVTRSGRSLYWASLNKGKRSVALNVREAEGREIAHALITRPGAAGGILLSNLPARGWLDYQALKKRRDDLIMVNITGNRDGSVALDYTVNAAAGFPFVTGPEHFDRPVNHVMPVWDVVAAMSAVQGMLVAERHRRDTGAGQFVQIALSDTAFATLSHLGYIAEVQVNGDVRPRTGNHVYGTYGQDFETADGRRVMVTAFTLRHWQALVEATGTPDKMQQVSALFDLDLTKEENRFAARETITAVLRPWFAARPLAEIRCALDAAGACWGPYQTFAQAVADDPRISTANPLFDEIEQPGIGRFLAAGCMLDFSGAARDAVRPAPVLGQHTDEVLAEVLGLPSGKIGALHDAGIVGGPME